MGLERKIWDMGLQRLVIRDNNGYGLGPWGVGNSVSECAVKALRDVKVIGLKPAVTKNPAILRVGVAQAGCDPQVIFTT